MKHSLYILLVLLLVACGSRKKAVDQNNSKSEVKEITKVNIDSLKMIKEDVAVDDIDMNKVIIDSTFTEQNASNTEELNQKLTKREGYVHDLFSAILVKHVSSRGKVDYQGFKSSHSKLLAYINILQKMYPKFDNLRPNREEKLAYWINAYNALTIDLILRNYPVKSIKDIEKPWDQRLWKFGDKWLNLNDIEHQILRKMDEPRIHFAIVCASESCPKLQNEAFTAEKLETQLTNATVEFLEDSSKNELSENSIKISKIFKWFTKDFKTNGTLIDFLNQYSRVNISNKAKKSYKDYSWDLND